MSHENVSSISLADANNTTARKVHDNIYNNEQINTNVDNLTYQVHNLLKEFRPICCSQDHSIRSQNNK